MGLNVSNWEMGILRPNSDFSRKGAGPKKGGWQLPWKARKRTDGRGRALRALGRASFYKLEDPRSLGTAAPGSARPAGRLLRPHGGSQARNKWPWLSRRRGTGGGSAARWRGLGPRMFPWPCLPPPTFQSLMSNSPHPADPPALGRVGARARGERPTST